MAAKRPSITYINDKYKARANRDLNDNTARQFMAMLVLADGIDRAKSLDGEKVRAELAATKIPGEQTIMPWAQVAFGPDGQNVNADPVLIQYLGGKWVTIFPKAVAAQAAKWPM
jgi:branched-chain amino acid transport system substrate-binding protein